MKGGTWLRGHGQAEQQAAARDAAGPAGEHGVLGAGAAGVVQGLPQGLPHRHPQRGRVQEDLRQLLPLRRRLQVRRACLPHLRHQQRRHHRLPGVHHRAERDLAWPPGAEAHVGLQHVRPGRQRLYQPRGDAGDRAGHLQDGFFRDEDARGRVDPGKEDGENLPPNGYKQRRQAVPGGVHPRGQKRPVHRASAAVRPQQRLPVLSKRSRVSPPRRHWPSPGSQLPRPCVYSRLGSDCQPQGLPSGKPTEKGILQSPQRPSKPVVSNAQFKSQSLPWQ